jgi:putative tryptophan/tyrosine transport system permease protein
MEQMTYLLALNPMNLISAIPGNVAQGIIWGIMALGVFITFRLLNFADLTVDGTFATGGAVTVVLILSGIPVPLALAAAVAAGILAGLVTGLLNTVFGIPDILAGVGLSNILDSMGMQKFRRRQPMKRTHRHIIRAS